MIKPILKAITVTYESPSGDSHTYEIAIFTDKMLAELKLREFEGGPYYGVSDYQLPPINPINIEALAAEYTPVKEILRLKTKCKLGVSYGDSSLEPQHD